MKIAQVIASRGEGGLEKHVRELSQQLVHDGHEVEVIGDESFLQSLPKQIVQHPINCEKSRRNLLLLSKLAKILRANDYHIIHAQANKATAMISILRPFIKSPTVATLHNIKRDITKFNRLDHVITVSKQLSDSFLPDQVSVIYNGISSPKIVGRDLRSDFAISNNNPIFLAVGRLVAAKGFDILLEAVDGLAVNLLIAGEGNERNKLEQRVKQLNSKTMCQLIGNRTDIASLMAAADAVIISSRREGFSYVLNEALLMNKNVIATNVPVANEVLPAKLIVPIADAETLRGVLYKYINNKSEWQQLMQGPIAFSHKNMTLDKMTKNTVNVYKKLLDLPT